MIKVNRKSTEDSLNNCVKNIIKKTSLTFAHSPSQLIIPRAASNISPKAVKVTCSTKNVNLPNKINSIKTHRQRFFGASSYILRNIRTGQSKMHYLCSITRSTENLCLLHGCTTFLQPPLNLISSTNVSDTIYWCHHCLLHQFPIHLYDVQPSKSTLSDKIQAHNHREKWQSKPLNNQFFHDLQRIHCYHI